MGRICSECFRQAHVYLSLNLRLCIKHYKKHLCREKLCSLCKIDAPFELSFAPFGHLFNLNVQERIPELQKLKKQAIIYLCKNCFDKIKNRLYSDKPFALQAKPRWLFLEKEGCL